MNELIAQILSDSSIRSNAVLEGIAMQQAIAQPWWS